FRSGHPPAGRRIHLLAVLPRAPPQPTRLYGERPARVLGVRGLSPVRRGECTALPGAKRRTANDASLRASGPLERPQRVDALPPTPGGEDPARGGGAGGP